MDYYNENDPKTAAWLSYLIADGLIPDGLVDDRSIEDVLPSDLKGFRRCHFFAGIGGWAYALELAYWPNDQEVWTGSCPCQPFSTAGKGKGFADERHLWPAWFWLIQQCRPPIIVGEQVASKAGRTWFDLVSTDLEGEGYACGAANLAAASVGAPHIRQRLFWVADASSQRRQQDAGGTSSHEKAHGRAGRNWSESHSDYITGGNGEDGGVGYSNDARPQRRRIGRNGSRERVAGATGLAGGMADPDGGQPSNRDLQRGGRHGQLASNQTSHLWQAADWIPCRDGKSRPVEPGTLPLAHGVPARVGRLRGYGNAIVPQVAQVFIEAYLDTLDSHSA